MPGPVVQPGEVIRLRFPHSNPPKIKICLCICIEQGLFLVISSAPYRAAPADSQITIFQSELECLQHDSWLDTSKAYELDTHTVELGAAAGVFRLADSARARIKHHVTGQPYLTAEQKALVLANL